MTRPRRFDRQPDFETFRHVLLGEARPRRVHFVELAIDPEIAQYLVEHEMKRTWVTWPHTDETRTDYWRQILDLYYYLGYDFVPVWPMTLNMPASKTLKAADTADLSRGQRSWVDQGPGLITSWDDFERFPWDDITWDYEALDVVAAALPDGMAIVVSACLFEVVLEQLIGFEPLLVLIHDDRRLVDAVLDRWGRKVLEFYQQALKRKRVGAIFHGDDLGFRTGTLLSPNHLRELVFPWFKRYVSLAHESGRMAWLHSCGNLAEIIDDLVDHVGFDALHSFQDAILPVTEFTQRYGHRVAALGGVDMDRFTRLGEPELRQYVRQILESCMQSGRFALGSGNSPANYVPVQNYLAMLDEGARWTPQ